MAEPTRADLEAAAALYFRELFDEVDQPRQFDPEHYDQDIEHQVEISRAHMLGLEERLVENSFDGADQHAGKMAQLGGIDYNALSDRNKFLAKQLATRAEIEQMRGLIHMLTHPEVSFQPKEDLFRERAHPVRLPIIPPAASGPILSELTEEFFLSDRGKNMGISAAGETRRFLGMLEDRVGRDTPVIAITKDQLRELRTNIGRLRRQQGKSLPEHERFTDVPSAQVARSTAKRYWQGVQAFFRWAASESLIEKDPTVGLAIERRKGEKRKSPEAFSTEEIEQFLKTPLYSGYASASRRSTPGDSRVRDGHWWSGLLFMHTGMRAGELAQLLPEDFVFNAPIPYVKVREENDAGDKVKSVKNSNSVRDVPLAQALLDLGIAQFVAREAKRQPKDRVFRDFRTGTNRKSDGLTKFWTIYLKKFDLWKPGRSTHVWRHTVIGFLRANGVINEDIAAVVGHGAGTITAEYGPDQQLSRKLETINRLDFGVDVVGILNAGA